MLDNLIAKHKHITAVVFYGGEWELLEMFTLIAIASNRGLKTCLYTGLELDEIPHILLNNLDAIKTGRYVEELGGLSSPTTNQKFIILKEA